MVSELSFRRKVLDVHSSSVVNYCLQCARCTMECPIALEVGKEKYNPRELILNSFLGFKDAIFGKASPAEGYPDNFNLWGCTTCDKCDEVCPQNIKLTEIFYLLRNMSVDLGQNPDFYTTQAKTIFENGVAIPVMDAIKRRRTQMGLAETLPQADLKEIQKILEDTGIKKILK